MYEYVAKALIKPYRKQCMELFKELKMDLEDNGIKATIGPVGSGLEGLVTRDGKGPFDLDYNLQIHSATPVYQKDLRLLKDTIRLTLDQLLKTRHMVFSFGQDSTAALTYLLHDGETGRVVFKFDLGIIRRQGKRYSRLIHDKAAGIFRWEAVRDARETTQRVQALRKEGHQEEIKEAYLRLKNRYAHDDQHPSFVIFIETVNLVWQRHKGETTVQAPCSQ